MRARLSDLLLRESATLLEAMRAMESAHKGELPAGLAVVVDADGRLEGVVADGDIRRALLGGAPLASPVGAVMTRDPLVISEADLHAGIHVALLERVKSSRRMLDPATARVLVIDAGRRPVDFISPAELTLRTEMHRVWGVILAGGTGTRLWPLSRKQKPKQFLDLTGRGSMLRVTVERMRRLLPLNRIVIVTGADQADRVRAEIPELPGENILAEPAKRGTGPSIALAADHIQRIDAGATMLIVPSDHLIVGLDAYVAALGTACGVAGGAEPASLVTVGLRPTAPATGYGYLCLGDPLPETGAWAARRVTRFVEKPAAEQAAALVEAGNCYWNTGTFAWTVPTFFDAVARHAPSLAEGLTALRASRPGTAAFEAAYGALPDISIDYALMEHAGDVVAVEGRFQRIDVGDLRSLAMLLPTDGNGNASTSAWIGRDSRNNIVYSPGRLTALVGISETMVIVTDDIVLVCPKQQSQEIFALVKELQQTGADSYT